MRQWGFAAALAAVLLLGACAEAPPAAPTDPTPSPTASATLPAWAAEYVGRWIPREFDGDTDPELELLIDGSWRAWDGCNGTVGTWSMDRDGALTEVTAGPSTLIACDGVATAALFQQAAALERARDGSGSEDDPVLELLRLLDDDDAVLLELVAAEPR